MMGSGSFMARELANRGNAASSLSASSYPETRRCSSQKATEGTKTSHHDLISASHFDYHSIGYLTWRFQRSRPAVDPAAAVAYGPTSDHKSGHHVIYYPTRAHTLPSPRKRIQDDWYCFRAVFCIWHAFLLLSSLGLWLEHTRMRPSMLISSYSRITAAAETP